MLIDNNTYVRARFLGGALSGVALSGDRDARVRTMNAMQFGTRTAWPTGYQSVTRARVPPLAESGQMALNARLDLNFTADLRALGNMASSLQADIDLTTAANVLRNGSASLALDLDFTASVRGIGNMAAQFDIPGRPTANDIAQEVWNTLPIEGGLSGAAILRILLAVAAGKTDIAPGPPVVVTFRDVADTKNRVRAELTGSERDAVTIDGAA